MKETLYGYFHLLILLLGAFLFSGSTSKAEEPELIPFLINDFDLHNQNWCISQNPNNSIVYFANSDGLIEFNGINWTKYSLKDNLPLRSVAVDSDGKIFTGSFEDFGFWQHNNNGILEYQSLTHLTSIEKNDEIWKIYILNQKVYFQSFTSIYIYCNNEVEKVKAPYTMLFLHLVEDQFVVQILDNGLYLFSNSEFTFVKNSEIFINKKVHTIIPYGDGKWLVCTNTDGIFHFDGAHFTAFDSDASQFLKDFMCNSAELLNDSTFAFGSILNGLIITDIKGEIIRSFNTQNGLRNNTVLSLFTDTEAGLWVGLDEGVNYIDLLSPIVHYKNINGSFGTIYALLKQKNHLYIGSNHGLFVADIQKKGQFYFFNNIRFISETQGQVWTLEEYDNQIVCGHNDGTFLVNNQKIEQISSVTGGWSYSPYGDYLLGGTYTGVVVFDKSSKGEWQFHSKLENFNEPTRHLEVDYLGYVWASHHQKGISKIEISDDLTRVVSTEFFPSINGKSHNIKVFKINNRVVFTTSENIFTYDYVRNQIVTLDPLSSDLGEFKSAKQINHYQKNEYWFIKDDKLALFEINLDFTATKKYEIQLKNISLPQRNIQLVSIDTSTVLIPTPESFDSYNKTLSAARNVESKLKIDKVVFYGSTNEQLKYFKSLKDLRTKWNLNNVTVHFIAPYSFVHHSKQYLYRLIELDSTWQFTNNNHFTYLGLKHGTYTIEIKDFAGSKVQQKFRVGKPWYITYYAFVGYVLLFVVLLWLTVKYLKYRINRHREILAMEVKQTSLEQELDYKSYELMLTIRYLVHKNEILTELQKEINEIKEHSSKYPVKNLKNMERVISEGLDTQTGDWKNALNNLKLSQQGFFKKLMEQFPDLTTNDLRLCSYLRMNFSTKEIARLLNNSPRAIEISRYRLRKKMNLSHDVNLTEFLMSEIYSESFKSSDSA